MSTRNVGFGRTCLPNCGVIIFIESCGPKSHPAMREASHHGDRYLDRSKMSVHGTQATGARADGMAENLLELEIARNE